MPYLTRSEEVFVLNLGEPGQSDTENRLTPDWISQVNALLDEVEATQGPAAIVTTGTGKFYSNGFEPVRFLAAPHEVAAYLGAAQTLFARMLSLPIPMIAALQGHTFAAGAIFAMAHDVRVMRADRGFFCLPEIRLGLALPDGLIIPKAMTELLLARIPGPAAHQAIICGRRFGGDDARAAGIVDAVADADTLMSIAIQRAAELADTRGTALGTMKAWIYRDAIQALRERIDVVALP